MPSVNVTKDVDATPEALWALVEDFGGCGWIPGADVTTEGSGVGMLRIMNGAIREKLEAVDAQARTISYSIPDDCIPFPVTGYYSTMVVSGSGSQASLSWTCKFEPNGVSEAEASGQIGGMYETMIGWISDSLKAS